MPSLIYKYSFTCLFFTIHAVSFLNSLPLKVEDNPYDKFIKFLSENNCTMPNGIALPFEKSSEPSNFNYLSTPLQECQTADALNNYDEAYLLCKEIFDVLQNITCYEYNLPTRIDTGSLSKNVCKDFNEMQYVLPKRNDYLSAKLVDSMICRIMCTKKNYEHLCETLLWSYDALSKIKSAMELQNGKNEIIVDAASQNKGAMELQNGKNEITVDAASQNKATSENKVDSNVDKSGAELNDPKIDANRKKPDKPEEKVVDSQPEEKSSVFGSNSNNAKVPEVDINVIDQTPQAKSETQTSSKSRNPSTTSSDNETASKMKMTSPLKKLVTTDSNVKSENVNGILKDTIKENEEPAKEGILPDIKVKDEHHDNQENNINVDEQPKKGKEANEALQNPDTNNLLTTIEKTESPQQTKNTTDSVSKNTKGIEVTVSVNGSSKVTVQSEEKVIPDMKNELSNVNLQEDENKNTGPKTQKDNKDIEKPKLTDFGDTSSPANSPLLESTQQLLPDDEEQHQENKDQEQYNDTENEGDYPKPDYDNAFNPPLKNKDSDVKSSIMVSSQISNNYDAFNPRNSIGRIPEDIPMIPSFPEQEDSHFFFYFLSIVLILMAGYLIFHNKQKIIALIVEGRHERRRRCHGVGYKKLETK